MVFTFSSFTSSLQLPSTYAISYVLGKVKEWGPGWGGFIVCLFVSITSKYGSCNTLFHQLMRMQDRALMLEELRRPSCLSSTFCKITSIHLERRIKKASCYMALSPINLPATNTRMQLSRKRWHLIFWQLWKATSEKKQSWESSRHHSAAVKVKWLMATTFVFLFWQNLIY